MSAFIDPRPCPGCGGRVALPSGVCVRCALSVIRPQPGPQTDFLRSKAKFLLFGGAGGGGKSHALLLDAFNRGAGHKGWVGTIFRARKVDVTMRGGIWDKAVELFEPLGCGIRHHRNEIIFPGGAVLQFRHLDKKSFEHWRGVAMQWAGFDEANEMQLEWIVWIAGRMRSTIGVRPVARMTCNPDPDHALAGWVAPYLLPSGVADRRLSARVRYFARDSNDKFVFGETPDEVVKAVGCKASWVKSFAFIPSWLADNRVLTLSDPEYEGNLAMQGVVVAAQLLDGNWLVRVDTGGMLRRSRWGTGDARTGLIDPLSAIVRSVRAWDGAATAPKHGQMDPDFTVGTLMQWDTEGRFYVSGLAACRDDYPEPDRLMERTAREDGPSVTQVVKQGPGDDGKSAAARRVMMMRAASGGRAVKVVETKHKRVRAEPMSLELELFESDGQHRGYILNRDDWVSQPYSDKGNAPSTLGRLFWSQVGPFWDPEAPHDDIPDAMADAYNEGVKSPKRRKASIRARARASV